MSGEQGRASAMAEGIRKRCVSSYDGD